MRGPQHKRGKRPCACKDGVAILALRAQMRTTLLCNNLGGEKAKKGW